MHYYEHHIGDYAEATAHLSFIEDAAYSRLLRKYYASEKPLPTKLEEVQRLVSARTKQEREAVNTVLKEFFILQEDGWHNKRCDEEISRYKEGSAERKQKAAHEKERMRRHRGERARLFDELRAIGITPKWDTTITQLRDMLQRGKNAPATITKTEQERTCYTPATRTGGEQERTCNESETAIHKPDTITNTTTNVAVLVQQEREQCVTVSAKDRRIGLLCQQLRSMGINAHPQMPTWGELIPSYSDAQILTAAETARCHAKPEQRIHLNYLVPKLADAAHASAYTQVKPQQPKAENFDELDYGKGGKL